MDRYGYNLLAKDNGWEGLSRILILVVLLVLSALGAIIGKIKEKYERQRAEREEGEYEGTVGERQQEPARRPEPAQRAQPVPPVAPEVLGETRQAALPPPVVPQVSQRRIARRPPAKGPAPVGPRRLGRGVQREVGRMERGLQAEEIGRRKRIGRRAARQPTIAVGLAAAGKEPRRRILVDLGRLGEARRGIIYSEILGLPKGLRRSPESWER